MPMYSMKGEGLFGERKATNKRKEDKGGKLQYEHKQNMIYMHEIVTIRSIILYTY